MSLPDDLGGFVNGDPALASIVGGFRSKFAFHRRFNGMLGPKLRLLPHISNHSTLRNLAEWPLLRVVNFKLTHYRISHPQMTKIALAARRPIGISTAFAGSDKYGSNASLIELAELLP